MVVGRSARLRLGVLALAAMLFLAFTAEYRHLIEESVAHLRGEGEPHGKTPSQQSHRCHHCVTSQPQIVAVGCAFQPGLLLLAIVKMRLDSATAVVALFELPAERAPPLS